VAASLPSPAPLIVFVTAYDAYAIRAFDANAIDYLLKPCDQQRLRRAVQRVHERHAVQQARGTAPAAASIEPVLAVRQQLISERGATRIVKVDDIAWIETADNYVILHTPSGQPLLRQTLAGLLDKLGPAFQRCHRRAAVQLERVARIEVDDKGDGELLLHGGDRVPLSRQYRPALLRHLENRG
jgi:two-component system LytT family response regulator